MNILVGLLVYNFDIGLIRAVESIYHIQDIILHFIFIYIQIDFQKYYLLVNLLKINIQII